MLFDQFKVEQSNSLKCVVTGLNNDLRDVMQENLDLKELLKTVSLNVQFLPLPIVRPECSPTAQRPFP